MDRRGNRKRYRALWLVGLTGIFVAGVAVALRRAEPPNAAFTPVAASAPRQNAPSLSGFQQAVLADLQRQVAAGIRYRDGYYKGGEPPANKGVCTDVIIRAYRAAGVDLQRAAAADIGAHRDAYHLQSQDVNIDHRRCRNLITFFARRAQNLPTAGDASAWQPGDVVFWDTSGKGKPGHVGMIGAKLDSSGAPTIVHHWPGTFVSETEGLYNFPIVGHYRWPRQ